MPFDNAITDEASIRTLYRDPAERGKAKESPILDEGARSFIERSPFFALATATPTGTDVSPRGGPPGFVTVFDERRLAWADLSGNNRLDSFRNLLEQPKVGMLFMIPGLDETLRVNGTATLTADPEVLEEVAIDGKVPNVAVGIDVDVCFIHCAKAYRRAGMWKPDTWLPAEARPSASKILQGHLRIDISPEEIEESLEENYTQTIWEAGGEVPVPGHHREAAGSEA